MMDIAGCWRGVVGAGIFENLNQVGADYKRTTDSLAEYSERKSERGEPEQKEKEEGGKRE